MELVKILKRFYDKDVKKISIYLSNCDCIVLSKEDDGLDSFVTDCVILDHINFISLNLKISKRYGKEIKVKKFINKDSVVYVNVVYE